MAGEEGPLLKTCITGIMAAVEEAAKPVPAGCSHGENACTSTTSASACIGEAEKKPAAAAAVSEPEADNCALVTAAPAGEETKEKRMTRLPQEEVDWILAHEFRAPSDFEALRRSNPDLTPPAGEELDESTELLYDASRIFFDGQEEFFKFQDQVRQEFKEKGFVEVDDEYLVTRAYNRAMILETWQDVCGHRVFSDDDDDECDEGEFDEKPVHVMEAWLRQ